MATETGRFTFLQLQALGEVKTILSPLVSSPGLHPFLVYLEFSKIIGKIGFFTPERVPPEIPLYDHDQLGKTFFQIRLIIENILNLLVEPEYKERSFIGAGLRMEVPLESGWVEKGWQMFIGVQGSVSPEQLVFILTQPGFLDLKVASSQRVDMVFRSGRAGLKLLPVLKYPIILPSRFAYFRILVESISEEWVEVCKTLSLAFRLNEKRILGPIQDQKVIKIQSGSDEISMDFTLFMVPEKVLAILEKTDISLDSDR
jgi:type VI secretion system protein ImpJ